VEIARRDHGRLLDGTCHVCCPGDVIVPPTGSRNPREMLNNPKNARIGIVNPTARKTADQAGDVHQG
jgi:hypothetical protein